MTDIFYGFVGGMIIGLLAATVLATLVMPPSVTYQHFQLDGKTYDCVLWREHTVCDPVAEK